jgi:hypothetical protein
MRVGLVWADCSLVSSEQEESTVDAFWVECSPVESVELVEPQMNEEDHASVERMRRDYGWPHDFGGRQRCCFLVARDLSFIRAFPAHYPFHQLWNGYSPFRETDDTTIDALAQLAQLSASPKRVEAREGALFVWPHSTDSNLLQRMFQ